MGSSGKIIKTTNGGTIWTSQTSGTTASLSAVHFVNADTGYAAGVRILKTTNGGITWDSLRQSPTGAFSLRFFNANFGYGFTGDAFVGGSLIKTVNGGATWTTRTITNIGDNNGVNSGYCIDTNVCYAVGGLYSVGVDQGVIVETTDGGKTWTSPVPIAGAMLTSVHFASASTGYAVGRNGKIWKHTGLPVPILASKPSQQRFGLIRNGNLLGYTLSHPSRVQILTFDMKGRLTLNLSDGIEQAGYHTKALPVNGATGVQILDFRADGEHKAVKVMGD